MWRNEVQSTIIKRRRKILITPHKLIKKIIFENEEENFLA
jgi:hypothetical protein